MSQEWNGVVLPHRESVDARSLAELAHFFPPFQPLSRNGGRQLQQRRILRGLAGQNGGRVAFLVQQLALRVPPGSVPEVSDWTKKKKEKGFSLGTDVFPSRTLPSHHRLDLVDVPRVCDRAAVFTTFGGSRGVFLFL